MGAGFFLSTTTFSSIFMVTKGSFALACSSWGSITALLQALQYFTLHKGMREGAGARRGWVRAKAKANAKGFQMYVQMVTVTYNVDLTVLLSYTKGRYK
jgi:hypothetical protein